MISVLKEPTQLTAVYCKTVGDVHMVGMWLVLWPQKADRKDCYTTETPPPRWLHPCWREVRDWCHPSCVWVWIQHFLRTLAEGGKHCQDATFNPIALSEATPELL